MTATVNIKLTALRQVASELVGEWSLIEQRFLIDPAIK